MLIVKFTSYKTVYDTGTCIYDYMLIYFPLTRLMNKLCIIICASDDDTLVVYSPGRLDTTL